MTPEEIDRTIEFLLQHGAQIDARLDRLTERHDREISQLTDLVVTVERRVVGHDGRPPRHKRGT